VNTTTRAHDPVVTDEPRDIERRDAWAVVDLEAAVGVVTTTVGAMLGPAGAVVGALVGPYARHAATRLLELRSRVEEAGVDTETIVDRLDHNEELAQLIAEAVRATVESDLAAKRALLARAAIRALEDDAVVDIDQRIVRAAAQVDTVDVHVLAIVAEPMEERPDPERPSERRAEGTVYPDELESRWSGAGEVALAAVSTLIAAGLIENAGIGTMGGLTFWRTTPFGRLFLEGLREEGLDEELRRREQS
jgi:hypothetical protein